MSAALGFALDAAGTIATFALLAEGLTHQQKPKVSSQVKIVLGDGTDLRDAGGAVPHIALWDEYGHRIGQHHPGKKEKIKQGQTNVEPINIEHAQTEPKYDGVDPGYILLSQSSDDAICVAQISVMGPTTSASFVGDTGKWCGQTCGINARALSFHLRDMQGDENKAAQYNEDKDTLCKSTPRFSFWGNLLPNGIIPFFDPPLEYEDGNGRDVDRSRVVDNHQFNKGVYMSQSAGKRSRSTRSNVKRANHDPAHLVIASEGHKASAQEVCDSATSYGWDIVSVDERLFCDIEHKQLYPLCSSDVSSSCFDMDQRTLRGPLEARGEEASSEKMRFGRSYDSIANWTMTAS
ncbi:hypothetical protein EJ05DRAFT_498788 [Pseudovirgaria hyperparasitica]|uniref:Uncharacterized protein n=1 Tax=Pseudovirgaria hyperparasitica TaxID=470096 RepID=A0A6A6WCK1_9PEZI|nr:uncharacterized protein EJ05DRAFT_498788 [Pseudovirgaria hyperparasitica]KAF2759576.1 hypothetical protein EJ05DRAFT_498788 [Pseudovirgaria hyperparasitica]